MMSGEPLLSIRDLCVRYGPALALDGISLDVAEGDAVAVLGPNGAGKSTLARAASRLVPATNGTIHFDGEDITRLPAHQVRRKGLIYLPEGRGIFPGLTVTENLRIASSMLPRNRRKAAIEQGLEIFPSLAARRGMKAGMLSGGEQQMLSLSRGLVLSPRLIIADEMSLGLAPKLVDLVFESLRRFKTAGVTIVLIEQFIHRALGFADEAIILSRGRSSWQGPTKNAEDEILTHYLGEETAPAR
ncbi:ABC transporter ATP-binding protein [Amycolatopsis sp. GM8]|uniref:ABC transporter ATP-binding protein n=1 Tax=Amycolatopsis sp. GM8 TaxID=2896530 RepID=UPI001F34BAD1|nr:ABC transporter ATP-binding protein [Amycolatopsis sp. GM8]